VIERSVEPEKEVRPPEDIESAMPLEGAAAPTPRILFSWKSERRPMFLMAREWLVTNGLGGYASGTLLMAPTRRYHGLFVPNLPSPNGRTVLVPLLLDELDTGARRVVLSGTQYEGGRIDAEGNLYLRHFRCAWQRPLWLYEMDGRLIERTIVMPFGQNTAYCIYRLISGEPATLRLAPFVTFRGHDRPLSRGRDASYALTIVRGRHEVHFPGEDVVLRLAVRPERGVLVAEHRDRENVLYPIEKRRGYDFVAEISSPGFFQIRLEPGTTVGFVMSTEPWERLDPAPEEILAAERARLERNLALAPDLARTREGTLLLLAADQFITMPGARTRETVLATAAGEPPKTVIAGYHWFTDWGRDTMISLEGLCLSTGRHTEAREILRTFAHYVRDGLLPNHFPEGENEAIYNTVDATFWFFHAIDRYLQASRDPHLLGDLFPTLEAIIARHVEGTRFGIRMDETDGLITQGADGYALTWMDAKVGDWVVTPRHGKPVEIQALWYNALRLMAAWSQQLSRPSERYPAMAARAAASFNSRFWYEDGGYLYDVVDGEPDDDASMRPNQVFAISLPFPILEKPRWRSVVDRVTERLLTPVGLRTLDPAHPDYHPRYYGDLRARDAAYHQGTVWPWLIGAYLDARRRAYPEARDEARFLRGFFSHLRDGGIGTISEIHDAQFPYAPRGCIAQAWSVAEIIRSVAAAPHWAALTEIGGASPPDGTA